MSTDTEQPRHKRRKHYGVRYGSPGLQEQQQQQQQQQQQPQTSKAAHSTADTQSRQAVNHQLDEHTKAEAQLAGRKFHLDTSCCFLPTKAQLFSSDTWSLPQMMAEKEKLNAVKDMLDCKDIK